MSNQPFNPFEFLNTPWGKLPIANSAMPGTDINELDKRISELKNVEQWLTLNLNLLRTTIQGMEIQRGTLAAISAFGQSFSQADAGTKPTAGSSAPPGLEQATMWWDQMQDQFGQMLTAAQASAQSMVTPQETPAGGEPTGKSNEKPTAG
jgi:hypothetical protein